MKKIKFSRKLMLHKETIVDLDGIEMKAVQGGKDDIAYPVTTYSACLTQCPSGGLPCLIC